MVVGITNNMDELEKPLQGPKTFETHVLDSLPELLSNLDTSLPEMVKSDERLHMPDQKPPKNIGSYSFTALTRLESNNESSLNGSQYNLDHTIQAHYDYGTNSRPDLDGPAAIGIVVERDGQSHLAAVAAASLQPDGTIRVEQIQGAITKDMGPQLGGFRWQETLMCAWDKVAAMAGANALQLVSSEELIDQGVKELAEQGDQDNIRFMKSHQRHYDKTAENLDLKPIKTESGKTTMYRKDIEPSPLHTQITESTGPIGAAKHQLDHATHMLGGNRHSTRSSLLTARALLAEAIIKLEDTIHYSLKDSTPNRSDYHTLISGFELDLRTTIEKIDEQLDNIHTATENTKAYRQKL